MQDIYDYEVFRDEVRYLIEQGQIRAHQPLYMLCKYMPTRDWPWIEQELEHHNLLPGEPISELLGNHRWDSD